MQQLIETLTASGVTSQDKFLHFKAAYPQAREIIQQHRNSAAIRFLKYVAHFITIGLASRLGIWNVKGEEAGKQMEEVDKSLKNSNKSNSPK